MAKTLMEVYSAYGQGMMSGTDSWKEVLGEDVTFNGPAAQAEGKEAFIKVTEEFMKMIRDARAKNALEAGDFVITQVEIDVAMPSGNTITLDMCEWYEIRDEKIQSVKVYYDAEEYKKNLNE